MLDFVQMFEPRFWQLLFHVGRRMVVWVLKYIARFPKPLKIKTSYSSFLASLLMQKRKNSPYSVAVSVFSDGK